MSDLKPITPAELCWGEADGAVSINAVAVAKRLNELLEEIQKSRRPVACQCGCEGAP